MRIVAIAGSVRPGNYTSKALALVVDELKRRGAEVDLVDPADYDLPLPGAGEPPEGLAERVGGAVGVVLSTPEYHGGMSSVIKLVIDNLGFPSALSGKPVALLGVAAGAIGAIKALEQLRSVASHVGAIVLPGPVSVARVQKAFDGDGEVLDGDTEKRVRGVATHLLDYIERSICPRVALEAMARE